MNASLIAETGDVKFEKSGYCVIQEAGRLLATLETFAQRLPFQPPTADEVSEFVNYVQGELSDILDDAVKLAQELNDEKDEAESDKETAEDKLSDIRSELESLSSTADYLLSLAG